jgi:8-oxo-dGTP diphosphatase
MTHLEPPPRSLLDGIAVSFTVACAFFTDPDGRVLLVKPNYREGWAFVGGLVDTGESPHEACARETREEIGLDVPPGGLLVLDWVPKHELVRAPLTFYLFDGGVLDEPERIRLQADELDEFGFFPPERAAALSAEINPGRVELALEARRTGATAYQPTHRET